MSRMPDAARNPDADARTVLTDADYARYAVADAREAERVSAPRKWAPDAWHASRARWAPCHTPGCFGCFYDRLIVRPLAELEAELAELEARRPRVGIAWPQSNYFRALRRACADLRRDGGGTDSRACREDSCR